MAKKRDEGHEETEKVLADIEKEISKEYAQAEKEISEKLDDYLRRFEKKDEIKYNAWQEGKITKEEYEQWRVGQIAVGKQWEAMKNTLADDYANAAQIAKSITDGHMPEVYSINHAYGTYQVEKVAGVDTKYIHNTMYDRQSVEHLFKGKGKLYHDYGIKTGLAIAEGKQKAWDRKQIQSVMTQSLLQGESIGKIATRLSKTVGDSDRKACIRNARTMTTGVQNAGRVDSYKRAESMGIELEQEWLATLDSRTRHEHRMLDGQRVKVGEKFKVDGYELEFPADPEGEAFLVYNCRCTLVPALKGFAPEASDLSLRNTNHMEEETYEEWKESHNITSDSITKQDDIARAMRNAYNKEYSDLANTKYVPVKELTITSPIANLGNAETVMDYNLVLQSNDYMNRMNKTDAEKFRSVFSKANFVETTGDCAYKPSDNKIYINPSSASDFTAFHESTHWFDFNAHYKITDDWGHYEYNDDGTSGEWISKVVTIKENASFSEYIAWKWDYVNQDGGISSANDFYNFNKILGLSGKSGDTRNATEIVRDIVSTNKFLEDRGISKIDPDYVHLSDFLSAMSFDATGGFGSTGGHEYKYWAEGTQNRVTEITAGYNILKALGREDLIQIEKELAPNLMKMIEEEWSKIW